MALTKVGPKFQVTIPKVTRDAVGLDVGDLVETSVQGNNIVLKPKTVVEKHPAIDAAIREGLEDVKAGRVYGPFNSAKELVSDLHKRTRGAKTRKTKKAR
jgi:AbrB family looped-hinge helix DNA binding protein